MAWSTPMTAVNGNIFTAAQYNQYVRDNLNMTFPAHSVGAGSYFVTTGPNTSTPRAPATATITTSVNFNGGSYGDPNDNVGPSVTVTTGTSALVMIAAAMDHSVNHALTCTSFEVSGSSSIAADDEWAIVRDGFTEANICRWGAAYKMDSLTAGSNTFKIKLRTGGGAGTGTWEDRTIIVVPL